MFLKAQMSTPQEYAVLIVGMAGPSENELMKYLATEIIASTHTEIVESDSMGIRQVLSITDMRDAMKEFSPDGLTCQEAACVEEVAKKLSVERLILIELDQVKFSGDEKERIKVSGTIKMSLINVELIAGTDVIIMLTENTVETKLRGTFKELVTTIRVNTWTLFGSVLPKERFSEDEIMFTQTSFSQKIEPYLSNKRFILTVAVAAGLLIGGVVILMVSSNDVTHTYPPDFPEIP